MNDEEEALPSWIVADNDEKHKEETVAPLFGSGALNLLDDANNPPTLSPSSKSATAQETSTTAASYGSTDVTSVAKPPAQKDNKKQKNKNNKKEQRTEEQAKREITSLAEAFGRMQHKKQETEENRRLFKHETEENRRLFTAKDHDDETAASKSKAKSKKKTEDAFGPIDSHSHSDEEKGEQDDDNVDDEEKRALLLKEQLKPHIPPQNACLWFFHAVNGLCVVTLLCLIATQVIPVVVLYRDYPDDWWRQIGIFSLALKVYISVFSLIFILVELPVPLSFLRTSNLLRNFISRGWIYSFVGLVATSEAYQEHVQNALSSGAKRARQESPSDSLASIVPWEAIFMQVSAWVMLGIGLLYILLGICCLQPLYERLRDKERQDWQKYRTDYKAWKAFIKRQ